MVYSKLCLNDYKTHFIVFELAHDVDVNFNTLIIDIHIVERVKKVCYLNFFIDERSSRKFHFNSIHNKIAKGL